MEPTYVDEFCGDDSTTACFDSEEVGPLDLLIQGVSAIILPTLFTGVIHAIVMTNRYRYRHAVLIEHKCS